jgi:hypothetical protein
MRHRISQPFGYCAARLSTVLALPLAIAAGIALAHDHREVADTGAATAANAGEKTIVVVSAPSSPATTPTSRSM